MSRCHVRVPSAKVNSGQWHGGVITGAYHSPAGRTSGAEQVAVEVTKPPDEPTQDSGNHDDPDESAAPAALGPGNKRPTQAEQRAQADMKMTRL